MTIASKAPDGFQLNRRNIKPEDPQPGPSEKTAVKLYSLADFDGPLLEHVRAVNAAAPATLRDLVWALAFARNGASELDKLKAIFLWVATQELFDEGDVIRLSTAAGAPVKPRPLAEPLREPLNNRKNFSTAFTLLCENAGLLVLTVGGQKKNASFRKGSPLNETDCRHNWNLVYVNGEWRAVDLSSAAAKLLVKQLAFDEAVKELEYFYFLTYPEYLAFTHHPDNPAHQLLATPVSVFQFQKWPILKPAFFKCRMQLHSADSQVGVIVDRTSLELHYLLPAERAEDYVFCARLDYEDGPDNYNGVKLSRYGIYELFENQVQFHVRLPEEGKLYRLSVFVKEQTPDTPANAPLEQVAEYRVQGLGEVLPYPPLRHSAYGPTEHALDFDIRPLFDEPLLHIANGEGEIRFAVGKNVRLTASLKTIEKVSKDDLDLSVFTRTVVGEQYEGIVALHVPTDGEYGLEVFAYDPNVQVIGSKPRLATHVWSVFIDADAGSPRHRKFPKLVRTFLGPQIDNVAAGLVALSHEDPYIKVEAVAEQVKELTLEFQLTNELRLNHELKEVEVGAEKQIKNFLLGELNLTGNKLKYTLRFTKYGFFLFGVFGHPKGEDREKLPSLYTYLIEVVPPKGQDESLKLAYPLQFPIQSAGWPLGCHLLEPIDGVLTKEKREQGPIRFHVEIPKKFEDRMLSGQVERLMLWTGDLPPSWLHVERIGEGSPTETWAGELNLKDKKTESKTVALAVMFSGDARTARVLLDYTFENEPPSSTNCKRASVRESAGENAVLQMYGASSMDTIIELFTCPKDVTAAIRKAGLDSTSLVFGIDYTESNLDQGARSFHGKSLHAIDPEELNPYQRVILILGEALESFDDDQLIPIYGFGDSKTRHRTVFPIVRPPVYKKFSFQSAMLAIGDTLENLDDDQLLTPAMSLANQPPAPLPHGYREVFDVYTKATPRVKLSGPTNFAPLILKALENVRKARSYHILVIVADGQVSRDCEAETIAAIVEASKWPMSIVMVGVGDGPWNKMTEFDDSLHAAGRMFDNFQFVAFDEVTRNARYPEAALAMSALMEIPDQYNTIRKLGLLNSPAPGAK